MILQELKEAYYTELSASKAATSTIANSPKDSKPADGKAKPLVKKRVAEDPFASDDETDPKGGVLGGVSGKRKVPEGENEGGSNKSSVKRKKIL